MTVIIPQREFQSAYARPAMAALRSSRLPVAGAATIVADSVHFGKLRRPFKRKDKQSAEPAPEQTVPMPVPVETEALKKVRKQMKHLIQALCDGDEARLEKLMAKTGGSLKPGSIQEVEVPGESRLLVAKQADGELFFWLDLQDLDHPELKPLSDRYTFSPFDIDEDHDDAIAVEMPVFDRDSVQLTAYCLGNIDKDGNLPTELMHLYAGKDFLITTHDHVSPTLEKKARLLMENGRFPPPPELVSSIMDDLVRRYSRKIEACKPMFRSLQEQLSGQQTGPDIVAEFLRLDHAISKIDDTLLQQKRVLEEVISINRIRNVEFIKNDDLKLVLDKIDQLQTGALDKTRDRYGSMVSLNRSNMSGKVEASNKRLAALGTLVMPYMVISGLMGMNVIVPGAGAAGMFWMLLGGATATSGGLYVALKKKKWI